MTLPFHAPRVVGDSEGGNQGEVLGVVGYPSERGPGLPRFRSIRISRGPGDSVVGQYEPATESYWQLKYVVS